MLLIALTLTHTGTTGMSNCSARSPTPALNCWREPVLDRVPSGKMRMAVGLSGPLISFNRRRASICRQRQRKGRHC